MYFTIHAKSSAITRTTTCRAKREQLKRFRRLLAETWLKPRPESGLDCLICAELTRAPNPVPSPAPSPPLFGVWGLELRVRGSGLSVWGLGFIGLGVEVLCFVLRVQGLVLWYTPRVQGRLHAVSRRWPFANTILQWGTCRSIGPGEGYT